MKNWFRVACLAVGAGLAFASIASDEKAGPATGGNAGTARAGTVVDIKPHRIYLMDIEKAGDRLVAVGERGFVLVSDDAGKTWKAVGTPVVRAPTGVAFNGDKLGVAVGHGGSLSWISTITTPTRRDNSAGMLPRTGYTSVRPKMPIWWRN